MRQPFFVMVALLLFFPHPAVAQFEFVTGLFKEVQGITFYGQAGRPRKSSQVSGTTDCIISNAMCGAGTEVLIDLAGGEKVGIELGLGASFMRGFTANNDSMDLRGAVRSFPTLTVYATANDLPVWLDWLDDYMQPYIGASFGASDLWNMQAYDAGGFEYSLKSNTFDWGGTAGVYFSVLGLNGFFVESAYRYREFSSLDYTVPKKFEERDSVPEGWPRELDFTGWHFAAGWQFKLKQSPSVPSFYRGVWYLSRTDAMPLPATVSQDAVGTGRTMRRELVSGLLSTMGDTRQSYMLDLVLREVTYDGEGEQVAVSSPCMSTESGTYKIENATLVLYPGSEPDESTRYKALRIDEELRLQSRETGLGLVFKKAKGGSAVTPPPFTAPGGIRQCRPAAGR